MADNSRQQEYVGSIYVMNNMSITDITFSVTLTHENPGDLVGSLISPDGDTVVIFSNSANIPANTMHTFTVSSSDVSAMNNFIGDNAHGVWRFTIGDYASSNTVTIRSWGISIDGTTDINPGTITDKLGRYWTNPNQMYFCDDSIATLDVTNNVDPCNDLAENANRWNMIPDSTFTITESSINSSDVIPVYSQNLGNMTLAQVSSIVNSASLVIISADFKISPNHKFGDVNAGDQYVYDYDSVMTHEFGHIVGLDHNPSRTSVMFENATLNQHNINR